MLWVRSEEPSLLVSNTYVRTNGLAQNVCLSKPVDLSYLQAVYHIPCIDGMMTSLKYHSKSFTSHWPCVALLEFFFSFLALSICES